MRKSVLLTLIIMLALAMGFSPVASAANGGAAGASAKKKGKSCKKKGKGKKSAATSAKKKGKGCKSKGSKGKDSGSSNLPLSDGTYEGQEGVGLVVLSGGTGAKLKYAGGFDGEGLRAVSD